MSTDSRGRKQEDVRHSQFTIPLWTFSQEAVGERQPLEQRSLLMFLDYCIQETRITQRTGRKTHKEDAEEREPRTTSLQQT